MIHLFGFLSLGVSSVVRRELCRSAFSQFRKCRQEEKRKDEDIRASDDETETHAPAKKVVMSFRISKNWRVSVRNYDGMILIHMRDFWFKNRRPLPGKKGISLTVDQWNTLRNHAGDIDKAISHLSKVLVRLV